ncbi:hypothetical protein JCM19274_986 [Algibacter lectus]|uniref:Uncharacterized protein n=1 Tax=Algibacter lectus TaxID=221126 RepID=A0A090X4X1_9FLAO|nr:hypothetical protein JCM19274_986 [Algibacter lectus]
MFLIGFGFSEVLILLNDITTLQIENANQHSILLNEARI